MRLSLTHVSELVNSCFNPSIRLIQSDATIGKWLKIVETQGVDALQPRKRGRLPMEKEVKKMKFVEDTKEALLAENERLRMENAYLKKLNALVQEKERLQNKTKHK